jgi:pimeloyl-ACP methyl ester carboxylesterase
MPTIVRDGARVAWDAAGDGPAVLLGHSLLCDGRMWEPVLPWLQPGRRLLNVDARGHRRSTAPRAFTLEDLARDWLAVLDREGVSRAVLCGLSMGGMTALRVALLAPERVAGLVLLDTSAGPQPPADRVRFRLLAAAVRFVGFRGFLFPPVHAAMFGRTTRRERPEIPAALEPRIREHRPRELVRAVRAVVERTDLRADLPRIAAPTLVVVGEEDAATPPANARRIAGGIPGAALETIPRTGHLSTLEAPEVVGPRVAAFLDGLGWGARRAAG